MPASADLPKRPPFHNAVLLWLLTNVSGTGFMCGLMLVFAFGDGQFSLEPLVPGLSIGAFAGIVSIITIPFAALLFHLLPAMRRIRHRQLGAALGLTLLFLLPLLLFIVLIGTLDELLWLALPYWPATLVSAIYIYQHWLFPAASPKEET